MPDPVTIPRHIFKQPYYHETSIPGCASCQAPADAPQHYTAPVELSDTGRKWLDAMREADRQIAAISTTVVAPLAEKRETALRNLQAEIGDSEAATVDGRPVILWAYRKPAAGFDLDALRRDHPEIAAAYANTKRPARPFAIVEDAG